jgi:ABC-type phosphate/phosphonate transport system substrate-binding protein
MKPYRKRAVVSMFACLLTIILAQAARQEAERKADFIVAYTDKMLTDIDPKDMASAMKLYVDEISKQAGYRGEAYRYDTLDEVVGKVNKDMFDVVALTSLDYLRIEKRVDVELGFGQVKGGKSTLKYLLLANANRGFTKLSDLKNKKLFMPKGDDIAALYLSTVLLKNRLGEVKNFFSSMEEKTKPSQVVLAVFFGQADACVTTDTALKSMVEMNPQLEKAMNVVTSSPELVTSVTVFRRSLNADIKKKAFDIALKLKDSLRGKQILLLFQTDGGTLLKESDLAGIREMVSEYDRLRAGKR